MPAYSILKWEQWELTFKSKGIGIRKLIPIPYFSGTELSINVIIYNNSSEVRDLSLSGTLLGADSDSFETLTTYTTDSQTVNINAKDKKQCRLEFKRPIPQPGNYSVKLHQEILCEAPFELNNGRSGYGHIMYFDALPRDASITNWAINLLMLFLSACLGALLGWIAGHAG
jgi:hypothetical protein